MNYVLFLKQRLVLFLTLMTVAILVLGLAAECDKGDDGSDYHPTPGNNAWLFEQAAAVRTGTPKVGTLAVTDARPPALDLEGDSITDGGVLQCICDRLAAQASEILRIDPSRVIDNGIGGQLLTGAAPNLATRWAAHLAALQPGDTVVLDIGMNDLFSYPGDQVFLGTYHDLVVQALNLGLHVLVTTITPIASSHWNVELLRQHINGWILSVFADRVLDYSSALHDRVNGTSWADTSMIMPDGIHPSEGGTRRMAQTMVTGLRAAGLMQS